MSLYISTISKQKDSLEEDVEKRTQELKESKDYIESLFSNSPCAIYSVDLNKRIVDFNKKAEEITGYSKDEVIGKEFNLFTEHDEENEYLIEAKNRKKKTIERISSKLIDEDGNVFRDIESFIDITEKKELEKFKTDIEKIIRHDLKTPLNSIIGFPRMMLTDENIPDEYKEYLKIIISSGQNMLNLINASLDMYRIEDHTYRLHKKEFNIITLLKRITLELRDLCLLRKTPVEILIDGTPIHTASEVKIRTEESLLYMILTNLIKNAIEASPKQQTVTINILKNEKIEIQIHNQGVIPIEIRDKFFDKHITWGKSKGNGLGTYSAKIMSNALGANLYFDTDEVKGTTLFITI
jgi:PAS domain S-box-containing protein